jgi:putative tricarboxylic transport membrane protein
MGEQRAGIATGIGVFVFGFLIAWQTTLIPAEPAYAQVGPTLAPWLLVTLFLVLGSIIVAQSLRGAWTVSAAPSALDLHALALVGAGLFVNLLIIEHVGFILASTVLFLCTARAFGSRQLLRDGALGFALALLAYVGFDRLLGYQIGNGWIESLL